MAKYAIELHDVTPNRATVSRVHTGEPRSRFYALTDSADNLPAEGERVWIDRRPQVSGGQISIQWLDNWR